MKYIDAEKLKTEVENRYDIMLNRAKTDFNNTEYWNGKADAYRAIYDLIDSLQQEQPEVDLEKELNEWMKYGPHTCYPWCTIPDAIEITAEHFYELGLNVRKEE